MSATLKMQTLSQTPNAQVQLIRWGSGKWHFSWEGRVDGSSIKLSAERETIDQAVDDVHARFCRLTNAEPSLIGALPPPSDFIDADGMLTDDIPF